MRPIRSVGTLVIATILLSASTTVHATPPRSPISLSLKVDGLEQGESSGEVFLEAVSVQDAPGTTVALILPPGMQADRTEWTVDLVAGAPIELTTEWSLTAGPGNYTVSARATRSLGPGSSWGDMKSIPYHVGSAGTPAAAWKVDHVPVAKTAKAGSALVVSDTPVPFAFEDLTAASWAQESLPAVEAQPPIPIDGTEPAAASPPGSPSAAGTVTLTGIWQYPDRSGVPRAVDQQYLEIRHGDGTPLSPRVFCFTQSDGSFSCSFPYPGTTMRVWLRSATNLNPGPTRLGVFSGIDIPGGCGSDSIDCTYANSSATISCPDGATCSLGTMVAAGGEPWIGAHQMTQDLIRSWKKILFDNKHPAGTQGGPAKISYPTPSGVGPLTHALNNGSETTGDPWIDIPAPFQTAADVVAHEYGHAVMDNLWHVFSPNWATLDCPSPHYIGSPSGDGCALSEGFADYWSWYSNEFYDGDSNPNNNGPIYDDPGFSTNFETRDNGTYWSGDRVEGNVAGAFGDMMDATNDGPAVCDGAGDRMSDGIQHIWHVLASSSYPDFYYWFFAYWSTYLHPRDPALEVLSLNAIDYGFPEAQSCTSAQELFYFDTTDETDTTLATCANPTNPVPTCGNGSNDRAVFYHWIATGAGTVSVDTFGSDYDTILSVWTGTCGALVSRGCNDDTGGTQSQIVFSVASGDDLTFLVSAFSNNGGNLKFHFLYTPHNANNDTCSAPTLITVTPYSDTEDATATTTSASDPVQSCGTSTPEHSVFYRWTAPADGIVRADTFGSSYDTALSAHTGTCGSLAQVACSDDVAGYGLQSQVEFAVTTGTALTFMVTDQLGAAKPILLYHLDFSTPAPPHDLCTTAKVVTSAPYSDVTNTYGATTSPGEPAPGCGNPNAGKSVWYEYTPPADGTVTVDTLGSVYDTILTAWTGGCTTLTAVPNGCNDDYQPPNSTSLLQIPVTGGVTYRFQVSAYNNDGGVTDFHLDYAPNPPLNDGCGAATIVSSYPYVDVEYTAAATTDPGEPASTCGNGSAQRSVWYRFTAPVSGQLQVETYGSAYDTILSVWTGGCGALMEEGCNDDAPGSTQSSLTLPVAKGVTYRIRVSSYTGVGGVMGFTLGFLPDSGHVPDGYNYPGQDLTVALTPGGELSLDWGPSCLGTDTDYVVYEGTLGSWYSHVPALCSTGGALSAVWRAAPYDTYYLIAPRNAVREGSHGVTGTGLERPTGPATCLAQAIGDCAPACAHDICMAGGPLDPACSDCVAGICAQDDECCSTGWSASCADNAQRSCSQECN